MLSGQINNKISSFQTRFVRIAGFAVILRRRRLQLCMQ
jgi:hypothetical protein